MNACTDYSFLDIATFSPQMVKCMATIARFIKAKNLEITANFVKSTLIFSAYESLVEALDGQSLFTPAVEGLI